MQGFPDGLDRSVLQGLAVFRWAAWVWIAVTALLTRGEMARPELAFALLAAALAVTAGYTVAWRRSIAWLLSPAAVFLELSVGLALVVLDGLVRADGTVFATGQSLASVWPLTGVVAAGIVFGPWGGGAAGLLLGASRVLSTVLNDVTSYDAGRTLSLTNTAVTYAIAGLAFGYVYRLLVRAEANVAQARAREEVARTLHDGVLQTLAVVERRADDPALARLAREQERELRDFLFGSRPASNDLGAALRAQAATFEDRFDGRVQVLVADDVPNLGSEAIAALAGAVGEALTNAGKHGAAKRVTVYCEPADRGVFCSVKDDGTGFDPAGTPEGVGLQRSVRGRIGDAGGRVEVSSAAAGTEVRIWLPS